MSKFRFGIRDLPLMIVIFKIIGFTGLFLKIEVIQRLALGQSFPSIPILSKLISNLFIPPIIESSIISVFMAYFSFRVLIFCSKSLENLWGYRTFTLYVLINIIICAFSPFVPFDFLSVSIFLAFSFSIPNQEFLAMFFIPVKSKTLGIITLALLAFSFVGSLVGVLVLLAGLSNFLLFLLAGKFPEVFSKKRIAQKKKFNEIKIMKKKFLHECYYCGVTELDKDTEFRISSKDDQEYCLSHLKEENR